MEGTLAPARSFREQGRRKKRPWQIYLGRFLCCALTELEKPSSVLLGNREIRGFCAVRRLIKARFFFRFMCWVRAQRGSATAVLCHRRRLVAPPPPIRPPTHVWKQCEGVNARQKLEVFVVIVQEGPNPLAYEHTHKLSYMLCWLLGNSALSCSNARFSGARFPYIHSTSIIVLTVVFRGRF